MPDKVSSWEAIVIGGGVGGSAAAIRLAQGGKRVLLLEKETGAHHKVCGEFISAEAVRDLQALGLDLASLGAQRIENVRLVHGQRTAMARLPFDAASLSRFTLDEALLERAAAAGVHIRRGVAVSALSLEGQEWQVAGADGSMDCSEAAFLATGKHNLKNWPRGEGAQNDLIGFKMHFRLAPAQAEALSNTVEITLFDGGYAGLEPIENGMSNLCLVVRKARYHACGKTWAGLLDDLFACSPHLAGRLHGATARWERPLAMFGIPYGYVYNGSPSTDPGLFRLGDQMAVIPSFSGDGMAIALHTARLAASACLNSGSGDYHEQARRDLSPLVKRATRLSRIASIPAAQGMIRAACAVAPGLLISIAKKTRVSL